MSLQSGHVPAPQAFIPSRALTPLTFYFGLGLFQVVLGTNIYADAALSLYRRLCYPVASWGNLGTSQLHSLYPIGVN
ncbi:hypothetical protein V8C42DRAFT_316280 [Trichoderma barbatum]